MTRWNTDSNAIYCFDLLYLFTNGIIELAKEVIDDRQCSDDGFDYIRDNVELLNNFDFIYNNVEDAIESGTIELNH